MVDAMMVKSARIQDIVSTVGVRVDDAIRLDFTEGDWHQRAHPRATSEKCEAVFG